MKALYIASTGLRRFFRQRGNLFSVFLLPVLIVLLLGAMTRGAAPRGLRRGPCQTQR